MTRTVFNVTVSMLWHHTHCVKITDADYNLLAKSDCTWECSACNDESLLALNFVDAVDVFHFDFQQNLPTPKLTVGQQFYLRLLWCVLSIYTDHNSIHVAWTACEKRFEQCDIVSDAFYFPHSFEKWSKNEVFGGQMIAQDKTKITTSCVFFRISFVEKLTPKKMSNS